MIQISQAQKDRARYVRTVLAWHDMTQSDLGRLLGITQQAAGRKLKGLRAFKDDELLAIADAFGLDPGNLLRPPELATVLGAELTVCNWPVRKSDPDLLTWALYQLPQVSARPHRGYGHRSPTIRRRSDTACSPGGLRSDRNLSTLGHPPDFPCEGGPIANVA